MIVSLDKKVVKKIYSTLNEAYPEGIHSVVQSVAAQIHFLLKDIDAVQRRMGLTKPQKEFREEVAAALAKYQKMTGQLPWTSPAGD